MCSLNPTKLHSSLLCSILILRLQYSNLRFVFSIVFNIQEYLRGTCGSRVFRDGGESSKPLKVTSSGLAKHCTYAIPIGNGGLGAMVWGDVASEILQLNGKVIFVCVVEENFGFVMLSVVLVLIFSEETPFESISNV
ncbi:hypothetical protein Pint_28912 [Pistacia integerrima]|uniref:Uncharacterized protein n=1 Tax=Pistacia integerrima TaxID=434235 RepID=A0ACC0X0S9_9ROSI|nr:hypothetical protein Pint_28912 [Pistacia integerrima]